MNDKIVRRMHDVFGAGLDLVERLERQERAAFDSEHPKLLGLLIAGGDLDYDPIYNGELATAAGKSFTGDSGFVEKFFGVRYALACWLDELLTREDGSIPREWSLRWREVTMETRLYGGQNQRAWRFWDQARKAEGPKGSPEALEAFLWAVMLGFRGTPPENLDPAVWVDNVRRRVLKARSAPYPLPADRDVAFDAHPLTAAGRRTAFLRVAAVAAFAGVLALTVSGVKYLVG
jgi:hypothetical protein